MPFALHPTLARDTVEVARFATDSAWPGPVWGSGTPMAYSNERLEALIERLAAEMSG